MSRPKMIITIILFIIILTNNNNNIRAQSIGKYANTDCPTGRYGNVPNQNTIELGCPGLCKEGTYGFRYVEKVSNTCDNSITTEVECNKAATALNLADKTSQNDGKAQSTNSPTGCYLEDGELKYNNNAGGNGNTGNCKTNQICLCDNLGRTNENEACKSCPLGKFGNKIGQTSIENACPSTCPKGKHGKASGANRSSEVNACECNVQNATTCPELCPAGRFANSIQAKEANGCPSCPSGRYHPHIEKKQTGKCSHPLSTIVDCSKAAESLGLSVVTAENDGLYNADYAPSGCYYSTDVNKLYVNLHNNNKGNCGATRQCICNEPTVIIDKLCPNYCDVGTWGNVMGQKSKHAACPNTCPTGTEGVTLTRGSGIYASSEAVACAACDHGKFGAESGLCVDCPIGYTGISGGGCKLCEGNTFTDDEGNEECTICEDGKKIKMEEMPSVGCLYSNSSLPCDTNAIHNIGCEDDPIWTYIGFGCLGLVAISVCYCTFVAATKKPQYVDADESAVAQWKTRPKNNTGTFNSSNKMSAREQEVEATAVAIELSNGRTHTVDKVVVNKKVNLIKIKLQWKKLKEGVVAATTSNELVTGFKNIKEFLRNFPTDLNGKFEIKQKDLLDVASNKKAVSNLRKEIGVQDIWTEEVENAVKEALTFAAV